MPTIPSSSKGKQKEVVAPVNTTVSNILFSLVVNNDPALQFAKFQPTAEMVSQNVLSMPSGFMQPSPYNSPPILTSMGSFPHQTNTFGFPHMSGPMFNPPSNGFLHQQLPGAGFGFAPSQFGYQGRNTGNRFERT